MKRYLSIIVALLILFSMTFAFAAEEKITIDIQTIDYQTGKVVSKSYVENEMFRLYVDIDVPRFYDTTNLELAIETDGIEITEPIIELATGRYFIEGIVAEQPASFCVKVKDMAYEYADTAEDLYNAMKVNRSVIACYNFSAPKAAEPLAIPKTGDYTVSGIVMLALCLLAILCLYQTAKRAKR